MSRILFIMLATATLARSQSIETIIQKGHELAVTAVAVSPDSNYVATASRDKSAKVWNLNSGREVRSFLGHQASVIALDFSNDGKYLITGSNDHTVKIWEIKTGKQTLSISLDDTGAYNKRYGAGQERINDVAFDPQLCYSWANGACVGISQRKKNYIVDGRAGKSRCRKFSVKCRWPLACSGNGCYC